MNFVAMLFGSAVLGMAAGSILGSISRFLAENGVQYYWEAVGVALVAATAVVSFDLMKGRTFTPRTDVALMNFGVLVLGMIGFPLLIPTLSPPSAPPLDPRLLQIGLPIVAAVVVFSAVYGMIDRRPPSGTPRIS